MMAEVATRIESGSQLEQMETPGDRFIFAVVRGDMEVNETKLVNALKAKSLRPATEDEIRAVGAVPGYASPVGIHKDKGVTVIVDDAIPTSPNLVAGANEAGYHLRNVNYGRDYLADVVSDIAAAQGGDACPQCGNLLRAERGVEVGNIFKLGTWFSDAMGCTFLDADGQARPVIMGSYGIGSGRLLACIAEEHHDDYGLIWPVSVAPYQIHLVSLGKKKGSGTGEKDGREPFEFAERLYADLQAAGLEVLFDDRDETPGVKFNDADLIGLPIRLTVSERSLKAGGVEFKRRDQVEKSIIPLDEAISHVQAEIAALQAEVAKTVIKLTFEE